MKSLDNFLTKQYDRDHYHCVHFAIDVAKYLFDKDYSIYFLGFTSNLDLLEKVKKATLIKGKKTFKPKNGDIVLMTGLNHELSSHVGIYYDDRIIHLTENGVQFLPPLTLSRFYRKVKFYEPI